MNNESRLSILFSLLGGVLVLLFAAILLIVAWPAAAGEEEDSLAYMPFVSSPLIPVDEYKTDFTDDIGSWVPVRWLKSASYDVSHGAGSLDVKLKSNHSYVILSPLVPGPDRSYAVTFKAKIKDPQDKDQYGAVFSADRSGLPCPGDNTDSCFNRYYEFRSRYRDFDGEKYVEYRLRRIDGHDSNNVEMGVDLIEWTRATGLNAEDWIKWEIRFRSSGHIYVKANNNEQAANARDNKYHDQRYFGLLVRTNEHSDALVHFDKFEIVKED